MNRGNKRYHPSLGFELTYHHTHVEMPPETVGSSTGIVWCYCCGYMLYSDTGPARGHKAYEPCVPIPIEFRDNDRVHQAIEDAYTIGKREGWDEAGKETARTCTDVILPANPYEWGR
jgi:hypothetical protein